LKNKHLINLSRRSKSNCLIILDVFIIIFSVQLSFVLRFEEFYIISKNQSYFLIIYLLTFLFLQFKENIYLIPSRNFNISIIPKIIKNTFITFLFIFFINLFFYKFFETPRTITFICFFLSSTLLVFKHSLLLNFFYFFKKKLNTVKNNLIFYGPINHKFSLINEIKRNSEFNFLGFIDNFYPKEKVYEKFYYLKNNSSLFSLLKKKRITHLIISKKLDYKGKIKILKFLSQLNLRIIFLDESNNEINLFDDKIQFRPEYNDILGTRENNHLNDLKITNNFSKEEVLVTGAGGSIGSELADKLLDFNFSKYIFLDSSEISLHNLREKIKYNLKFKKKKIEFKLLNLLDYELLENIFQNNKISYIYHAAAYKHVNFVESNFRYSLKNNINITKNICLLAKKFKVSNNILISTDKAVKPKNIMGLSKRICEQIFKNFSKKNKNLNFIITRFGNVIGSSGSVLPIFRNCIENNLPLNVTNKKTTRYVMTIDEACALVIKSSLVGETGSIYVFDMGKPRNILEIAKLFINMYGFKHKVFNSRKFINRDKDIIPIFITGLQKGEKLHEELAHHKDLVPTKFNKLLISKEMFLNIGSDFESKLDFLDKILNSKSEKFITEYLKKMI
jgi:FlaA1/EpsC-like NDP-sugar epimerase